MNDFQKALDFGVRSCFETDEIVEMPQHKLIFIPGVKVAELFANTGDPGPKGPCAVHEDGRSVHVYRGVL